mmetsp:Transcript_122/g.171  ORF Transcript_122/g.171 Transcript_122/m.171 type:complete len:89 (-) Transcript_122:465-731(-)
MVFWSNWANNSLNEHVQQVKPALHPPFHPQEPSRRFASVISRNTISENVALQESPTGACAKNPIDIGAAISLKLNALCNVQYFPSSIE